MLLISTTKKAFFQKLQNRLPRFIIIVLFILFLLTLNWYLLGEGDLIRNYRIIRNSKTSQQTLKESRNSPQVTTSNIAVKFGENILATKDSTTLTENKNSIKDTLTTSKPFHGSWSQGTPQENKLVNKASFEWPNALTALKKTAGQYKPQNGAKKPLTESNYMKSTEREPNRVTPKPHESSRICPDWSLQPMNQTEYGTCTPHIPTEESCKFAREIYYINSELSQCKTRGHGDVCEMMVDRPEGERTVAFKCNNALCEQAENGSFTVLGIDPNTGLTTDRTAFASVEDLQNGLPGIVKQNLKENLHFVFIECKTHLGQMVSQLFPFDPRLTIKETKEIRNENLINVNILLVDSISRAHFYRSLPKTVSTFQNWRENVNAVPAKVFDFELFQAVHGHTAENMHALFTGELFPVEDNGKTLPVGMAALFGQFKRAGYQTMWQEDLCWEAVWGLLTDLGADGWRDLRYKLRKSFIDHTGITHSSCKILKSLGQEDPFGGPEGDQICYNGKFQHSYFLHHTIETLRAVKTSRNALPLFSYTALNVGHDHRAIRTQTLDTDLESYVTALAKDENTLTIVLADHGNTYAQYTAATLEGQFEMFHPSLFVIVPDKVATKLGKGAMLALETNQRRLVTMIELHHSLKAVAGASTSGAIEQVGLFTRVSANRTCSDLELRTPNLCVCQGWDVPAENDSSRIPLAEFAIGQLNNILQEQYYRLIPQNANKTGAKSCRRLRPLRFENVRERNSKTTGSLITAMDIYVEAGDVVPQTEDIFHIEVATKVMAAEDSLEMKLLAYDRLTPFGRYETCADDIAKLKLCVCNRKVSKSQSRDTSSSPKQRQLEYFGQPAVLKTLNNDKCLLLMERKHAEGTAFGFEVANFCHSQTYRVNFDAASSNMKFSREVPFSLDIKPQTILFAFSVGKHLSYWDAMVDLTTTVLEL